MKQKKKITKNRFLLGFIAITFLLALIRLLFPSIAHDRMKVLSKGDSDSTHVMEKVDSAKIKAQSNSQSNIKMSHFFTSDGSHKKNRIVGVRDYEESFPDSQPQQLDAALRYGVKPVADRADAEKRKSELVYVGSNPYYNMKKLNSSIPYLVPRAAILLQDIARNFMDSLQTKGVPINRLFSFKRFENKGKMLRNFVGIIIMQQRIAATCMVQPLILLTINMLQLLVL